MLRFYFELAGNLVSDLPYALQKYVSPEMREAIERITISGAFDVIVCDFLTPAVNLPENLNVPTLLFQHNVEAMKAVAGIFDHLGRFDARDVKRSVYIRVKTF